METVVLTVRPFNVLIIALMVAVVLALYYAVVKAGVQANGMLKDGR